MNLLTTVWIIGEQNGMIRYNTSYRKYIIEMIF